jgi:hypothetical protein
MGAAAASVPADCTEATKNNRHPVAKTSVKVATEKSNRRERVMGAFRKSDDDYVV